MNIYFNILGGYIAENATKYGRQFAMGVAAGALEIHPQRLVSLLLDMTISPLPRSQRVEGAQNVRQAVGGWKHVVFTIPFMEELFFRGLVQGGIKKAYRRLTGDEDPNSVKASVVSIGIASILFSAYHLGNLRFAPRDFVVRQCIHAFVGGVISGYLNDKYGFLSAVVSHSMNNALAGWQTSRRR